MYAVCEFGGHSDLLRKYVYANGLLLARYDESPADNHYYHHDGLGSIMGLTNENGAVEHSYFYDEFGISLGSWGTIDNHYLYTGQEYDGSISSLYNLRARYYMPDIGRFISEDPVLNPGLLQLNFGVACRHHQIVSLSNILFIGDPQLKNAYVYVSNNPINKKDISGLISWGDKCTILASCYQDKCEETRDPFNPCEKWKSPEGCRRMARKWFEECMRRQLTATPPPQLPYDGECADSYRILFKQIGPYEPVGRYQ